MKSKATLDHELFGPRSFADRIWWQVEGVRFKFHLMKVRFANWLLDGDYFQLKRMHGHLVDPSADDMHNVCIAIDHSFGLKSEKEQQQDVIAAESYCHAIAKAIVK